MTLAIVTFLWRGWQPIYSAAHVNAWARMIKAHCEGDYRIVCVTDMPDGISECETFPLWAAPQVRRFRRQNCFTRLRLFDPVIGHQLGSHILHVDLDAVVTGDLVSLVRDEPFQALKGYHAPLNGSLWALRVGDNAHIWTDLQHPSAFIKTVQGAGIKALKMVGSDQVWLSLKLPDAPTWGPDDGVYQFSRAKQPEKREDARVVFFAGDFKPWHSQCRDADPKLYDYYQSHLTETA